MATLALAAVGAAVGSSVLPAGVGFLGVALSGATIGSQVGAFAGAYVDAALFGASGQGRAVEGPRLSDLRVTASTEGSPLPRIYGRARVGGQIIWASDLEEEIVKTTESAGSGKGGSGGGATLTRRSSARSPWRWRMPSTQAPSRSLTSATCSRRFR